MDDDDKSNQIQWAADELAQLLREGIKEKLKRFDTAQAILKDDATTHPERASYAVKGGTIHVNRGAITTLDQKAVKVFLGQDVARFEKTTPTIGLKFIGLMFEPAAVAAKTEP